MKTRTEPHIASLGRFAMATGTLLILYVLAGATPREEVSTYLIPLKLARPNALMYLLCIAAIYVSWRYWHYGVSLPLTRTKVRDFLRSEKSILILQRAAPPIPALLMQNLDEVSLMRMGLRERLPSGLPEESVIVITGLEAPTPGYVQELVAQKFGAYFPGIKKDQVHLEAIDSIHLEALYWAHMKNLTWATWWRIHAEDIDLYAPILVNVLGVSMYLASSAWMIATIE